MQPFALFLLAVGLGATSPLPLTVDAPVHDALLVGPQREVWLLAGPTRSGGPRRTFVVDRDGALRAGPDAPARAVAVDACPLVEGGADEIVYADARGIVDAQGRRILESPALFAVPDANAIYATELCGGPHRRELRLPVHDGVAVRAVDGSVALLRYPPLARAYSGRVHRGLRPERPYAMALSLYAPRLYDADVDGDGRLDLLLLHEGRLAVFLRGTDGRLREQPEKTLSLHAHLGAKPDADLRVIAGDFEGDARSELVVGVSEGAVPERSQAWLLASSQGLLDAPPAKLWSRAGLLAPMGKIERRGAPALLVSEVDTSLVALGSVLMTGQIGVKLWLAERARGPLRSVVDLVADADVRKGRMAGALPIVSVDFDGDGRPDLLDVGTAGTASLYAGTDAGFTDAPRASFPVPFFVHVVPLPRLPGVLLVGAPDERGTTGVALIGGPKGAAKTPRK